MMLQDIHKLVINIIRWYIFAQIRAEYNVCDIDEQIL